MQMKTYFFSLFFIVTVNLFAQQKLNKLSVNPIQLFGYNRLNMEYERGFSEGKYGICFYMGRTGYASRQIHGQYSWLSEQNVALKLYSKSMDKSSFWYGGMVFVSSGNIYDENGIDQAINIGAMGILATSGYQVIIKSFYLNPYIGAGYSLTNDLFGSTQYTGDIAKPSKWLLTYGLKLGFCF
jgi:hypothetical protein